MNGALPCQPIQGEEGAFTSAVDQSPEVDDGGGADAVFGEHRSHRKLYRDAGNHFTSF